MMTKSHECQTAVHTLHDCMEPSLLVGVKQVGQPLELLLPPRDVAEDADLQVTQPADNRKV